MRASEAPCSSKIWVHKYHSVRHDQREPSAVSVHDEHETGEFVRRPARHEARLHHQEHQTSKERNRSVAAPFNPYATPGLGGAPELAEFGERVSPERLAG